MSITTSSVLEFAPNGGLVTLSGVITDVAETEGQALSVTLTDSTGSTQVHVPFEVYTGRCDTEISRLALGADMTVVGRNDLDHALVTAARIDINGPAV
ncbi:OB-fold nucleic acid binding domain-containing protein [Streptomyces sp. ME19-01-6]|uniref:OB-fold nucleic acid binding domain-containing protein n=1 Tax=Streptomyces sp. ME19-01-6 TaxID=3028686 RepID=UPI0029BE84D5|nr:OB-fold nucleic acid binding domain-containing protein [Streptomyces sp. ME19-01-6]MDX3229390.1 OB-fold nucleic acid binding domain-containing protein [Streptomyces sp. ME19-01-6]